MLAILRSPNVASKEWIIRQYDHEVQGASVVKPLVGIRGDGPSDGAVIAPIAGESARRRRERPQSDPWELDPASLAECAIDEALRNVVAVGGDPERTAILDNYCWGNCDKPDRLGGLVRCSEAARDLAIAYGTPFISGKDSLNNEYRVGGESIAIPPTFLVSAISVIDDVSRCVTMDLKKAGSALVLVGSTKDELGASHLHLARGAGPAGGRRGSIRRSAAPFCGCGARDPRGDRPRLPRSLRGGLAVAAAEMAFAGDLGAEIDANKAPLAMGSADRADVRLFSETPSRFLLEIDPNDLPRLKAALVGVPTRWSGRSPRGASSRSAPAIPNYSRFRSNDCAKPTNRASDQSRRRRRRGRVTVRAILARAPGTNCERELAHAFERAGAKVEVVRLAELVNTNDPFGKASIVGFPGGFSYGDDVASGKIFAVEMGSRLAERLRAFLARGGFALGVCNGFQVLAKSGILRDSPPARRT